MKTESPDRSAAYWQAYLDTRPEDGRREGYEVWGFGEAADELGALIRDGIKTATCSLFWKYEYDGDALPQAGEQRVILDGTGWPMCVIETTEVTIRPLTPLTPALTMTRGRVTARMSVGEMDTGSLSRASARGSAAPWTRRVK